jgi:fido (protein-threonine AMPylation protein)
MSLAHALLSFKKLPEADALAQADPAIGAGFALLDRLQNSKAPIYGPMNDTTTTEGELVSKLLDADFADLLTPMKSDYIHFLHRLTTTGLISPSKCGTFRKKAVHISGNLELHFPPPSAVPKLMEEYCNTFPTILPTTVRYDPIRTSAEASHSFVRIHPYADGNGRVSRLLMNLVLWNHFLPVYLKADKKGRHRYAQALKRADRGNITPLACLIALSLKSIYERLLDAVGRGPRRPKEAP